MTISPQSPVALLGNMEGFFEAVHAAIPTMADDELINTYADAEKLRSQGWHVQAHCIAEAIDRARRGTKGREVEAVARGFEISRSTVYDLAQVWRSYGERLSERSDKPLLPKRVYVEAAQTDDPDAWLEYAEDQIAANPYFGVRDLKGAIDAEKRATLIAARIAAPIAPPPARERYGVILIDPPWRYANTGTNGAAAKHYGTLSVPDLSTLPLGRVAADDAVVILWATWPLLDAAISLIDEWGFFYKAGMPWIKTEGERAEVPNFGMGWWVRGASEPILIAIKGNPPLPAGDWIGLISPNFKHSKKPDSIYDYAESLPGPYLEVFARQAREGWAVVGDEIDGRDVREALGEMAG